MVITDSIRRNIKRKTSKIDDVKLLRGFPVFSFVELNINELCNRTCIFCPRHDPKLYPNQNLHMDLSLAEEIAKQLSEINFNGIVNISGTGEATLTKYLPSIVKNLVIEISILNWLLMEINLNQILLKIFINRV